MKYIAVSTFAACAAALLILASDKLDQQKNGSAALLLVGSLASFSASMSLVDRTKE